MQPEIENLLKQCIAGDKSAQHALFHRYKGMVLRLVCRLLGPVTKLDVEDTIQQVYIEIFKSIPFFRGNCSFNTWVYRIGTTVCMQYLRAKYRKRKVDLVDNGDAADNAGDLTYDPAATLEKKEKMLAIYQQLDKIDSAKRAIFVLYEMESKSIEEIVQIMSMPAGTVKSSLYRARKELARDLRPAQVFSGGFLAARRPGIADPFLRSRALWRSVFFASGLFFCTARTRRCRPMPAVLTSREP